MPPAVYEASLPELVDTLERGRLEWLADRARHPVSSFHLRFDVPTTTGRVPASGLLVLPRGQHGPAPLCIVFPRLTLGKGDSPTLWSQPRGPELFAAAGYAVLVPDYPGLGVAGRGATRRYFDAPSAAAVGRAMLSATLRFLIVHGVPHTADVVVTGHGEGGMAALALHRSLELRPLEGVAPLASCAVSAPHDLSRALDLWLSRDGWPEPATFEAVLVAANRHLWRKPWAKILREPYDERLPAALDGRHTERAARNELGVRRSTLLEDEFVEAWRSGELRDERAALDALSTRAWASSGFVLLLHGELDRAVPPELADELQLRMIDAGTDPERAMLGIVEGAGHDDVAAAALLWSLRTFARAQLDRDVAREGLGATLARYRRSVAAGRPVPACDDHALALLAAERLERDEISAAEAIAQLGADAWPREPECNALLGEILSRRGQAQEAREALARALAADPEHPAALATLHALDAGS